MIFYSDFYFVSYIYSILCEDWRIIFNKTTMKVIYCYLLVFSPSLSARVCQDVASVAPPPGQFLQPKWTLRDGQTLL